MEGLGERDVRGRTGPSEADDGRKPEQKTRERGGRWRGGGKGGTNAEAREREIVRRKMKTKKRGSLGGLRGEKQGWRDE